MNSGVCIVITMILDSNVRLFQNAFGHERDEKFATKLLAQNDVEYAVER